MNTLSIRRSTLLAFALTLSLLLMATAWTGQSSAKKKSSKKAVPAVGVGDNGAPMFADPNYKALGVKIARRMVPYDFYKHPDQNAMLNAWVNGALDDGVQPLIAFERSYTYPTKLPTVAEYSESLKILLNRFPQVTNISPWNEANHKSQPTVNNPRRAAQYFNQTQIVCPKCTIVAADVLDQKNMTPWLKKFKRYAKKPKIWGLHTYTDANHNKKWSKSNTKKFLKLTRKGDVWLTESGGIVAFNRVYSFNPDRAAVALTRTLNMGFRDKRIKRVYLYSWYGTTVNGEGGFPYLWDSGIIGPDGKPRPSYDALVAWLKKYPSAKKAPLTRKKSRHRRHHSRHRR